MASTIPPYFGHVELYFATRAPSQSTLVFASTATGAGVSVPYTTGAGDTNPLLPLMAADAPMNTGWVDFNIPASLPDETVLLIASTRLNITNPTSKIASIYLAARKENDWDFWAPEIQAMALPGGGDREAGILFIPVENRNFDLRWWISAAANATVADGMTCSLNMSLVGFGVNW